MKRMLLFFFLLLAGGVLLLSCSSGAIDRRTVATLPREELLGRWYEVARFNHRFERGLSRVEAHYRMLDDGTIEVVNSGYDTQRGERRETVGHAKFTDDPGRLRVSFFWKFYSDYNILERDAQGAWMLVGGFSPRYLWILSRTPTLPAEEFSYILERARMRGYDTSRLIIENEP